MEESKPNEQIPMMCLRPHYLEMFTTGFIIVLLCGVGIIGLINGLLQIMGGFHCYE